jgi:multicomponent K+:H+ antiporter subunit G
MLAELPLWLDLVLTVLLVVGGGFALVGAWALVRLPDFFMRLHGPTKATTLGVGCVLIASGIYFSVQFSMLSWHELLITLFLFMTAPVSAHLLVKAVLKANPALRPQLPRREYDKR